MSKKLQRQFKQFTNLPSSMASSFSDSVHELKTKFPVIEETPVFMFKFIFLAFSLDKEIFSLLLNMFI